MKLRIVSVIFSFLFLSFINLPDFKTEQKKFTRVKAAYTEKEKTLVSELSGHGIKLSQVRILICAFKKEEQLELWAKNKEEEKFKLIKTYSICSSSGVPGPKRKQGDNQVPEGFYFIDRFNPFSNFYLSLGISYPNKSDRILGVKNNLGGDVFIHGNCVTIGCIPITDDKIKELYLLAVEAKNNGQKNIPVYIFPARMDKSSFKEMEKDYGDKSAVLNFWKNVKAGYDKFNSEKKELKFTIDEKGLYKF